MDDETQAWLDAEFAPPLEPYEWGEGVNPEKLGQGRLEYVRGRGWIVSNPNDNYDG